MRIRFVAASMAGLLLITSFSTAYAGIESAVCNGNNIVVTGTTSENVEGEKYSLMLHNLYDVKNPSESVKTYSCHE